MSENSLAPIVEHLKYAEDMLRLLPLSEEYYRGLVSTVLSLLAKFRSGPDMGEFLEVVMKSCCDFYYVDWAGILIADSTSEMWTVDSRYDVKNGPMAKTHITKDEFFEDFPIWTNALSNGKAIFINNINLNLSENERYRRFQANDLIGFPFLFRPTGFIMIRNPQRYKDKTDLLYIITSIGELVFGKKETQSVERAKTHISKITLNILGTPSITVGGRTTSSNDFKAPVSWKVLSYLALNPKPVTAAELASKIGYAENSSLASNNMRSNIH